MQYYILHIGQTLVYGKFTLAVFIYLSRIFDTVNYQILLKKLKHRVSERTLAGLRRYLLPKKKTYLKQ